MKTQATLTGTSAEVKRRELLKHYAHKNPTAFYQMDVFVDQGAGDEVMRPDSDGDVLMGRTTFELMSGVYAVRVLIVAGTTQRQALRGLRKARRWVKEDWASMDARMSRDVADNNRAIDCPRCGLRPDGKHDELCQYPDGRPTELTSDEVQKVLQVRQNAQGSEERYRYECWPA